MGRREKALSIMRSCLEAKEQSVLTLLWSKQPFGRAGFLLSMEDQFLIRYATVQPNASGIY